MNTFVTQVSGDPGNDIGWTPWLVINTEATVEQVSAALQSVDIDVLLEGKQEDGAEGKAAAQMARGALTAAGITAVVLVAAYVFSNS